MSTSRPARSYRRPWVSELVGCFSPVLRGCELLPDTTRARHLDTADVGCTEADFCSAAVPTFTGAQTSACGPEDVQARAATAARAACSPAQSSLNYVEIPRRARAAALFGRSFIQRRRPMAGHGSRAGCRGGCMSGDETIGDLAARPNSVMFWAARAPVLNHPTARFVSRSSRGGRPGLVEGRTERESAGAALSSAPHSP